MDIVYRTVLQENEFFHSKVINNLAEFKQLANTILCNRMVNEIKNVETKVHA